MSDDPIEFPRVADAQLTDLEIAADAGDYGSCGSKIQQIIGELRALRQTTAIALADVEKWKQEHSNTCATVAMMHACAVGDKNGPRAGIVEDIINLRQYAIKTRVALDGCVELTELQEKRIENLTKARDTLGAIALQKSDPANQLERARIESLLKAGNLDAEQTPQIIAG